MQEIDAIRDGSDALTFSASSAHVIPFTQLFGTTSVAVAVKMIEVV
jgi:hypothetical protein